MSEINKKDNLDVDDLSLSIEGYQDEELAEEQLLLSEWSIGCAAEIILNDEFIN